MAIGAPLVGTLNTNTVAATTNNVPYPVGLTSSHIMVLGVSLNSTSATGVTLPAGWTQVFRNSSGSGAAAPSVLVAIKQATGSESGNLAVTTASAKSTAQIIAFAGVNLTTPQDVTATSVDDTTGHVGIDIPTLTTTRAGDALVYFAGKNNGGETATPPAGFTETGDNAGTGGWAGTMGYEIQPGFGATGTVTVTFTGTSRGIGVLIALRNADQSATGSAVSSAFTASRAADSLLTRGADAVETTTATLAAAGTLNRGADAALAETAGLAADSLLTRNGSATLAVTATLAADATVERMVDGNRTVSAFPLSGIIVRTRNIDGTLAVTATLAVGATNAHGADAAEPVTVTLTGGSTLTRGAAAAEAITATLDADATVIAGGNIKVWDGSAFVRKPIKVWDGAAWVHKPVKTWNGSAWASH